jgi:hypothetical protein
MRKKLPVLLMVVGTALFVFAAIGGPVSADPPGNNGTIKVDGVEFDNHPDNEPHVGCTFQIDFYGFDKGDLNAFVTFESQPPTDPAFKTLLTDTVFIGEDDNSGGGSEEGLDASETYTLDFTGFTPHDIQGFHVKLTINAEGSQGADVKHKVFWVTGCVPTTTTSPPPTTTTPTSPPVTTTTTTTTTSPPVTTTTTSPPVTTTTTTTTTPPVTTTTTPPPVHTTPPPATTTPPPVTTTTTAPPPVGGPGPGGPPNQGPPNQGPPNQPPTQPTGTAFTGPEGDLLRIGLAALGFLTSGSGLFLMGYRRRDGIELPPPPDQF